MATVKIKMPDGKEIEWPAVYDYGADSLGPERNVPRLKPEDMAGYRFLETVGGLFYAMKEPSEFGSVHDVAFGESPGSSVVERGPEEAGVGGSIPSSGTNSKIEIQQVAPAQYRYDTVGRMMEHLLQWPAEMPLRFVAEPAGEGLVLTSVYSGEGKLWIDIGPEEDEEPAGAA